MNSDRRWVRHERHGAAAELHEPTPPSEERRVIEEMVIDAPALVLGSSQPASDVDAGAAEAAGVSVVRRRSGGGAVLLVPGEHVWLDVWLPRSDPLWVDDVGRAGDWLADVWVEALSSLGMGELGAHRGTLETTTWSPQVCFAGLGPAEVTSEGRKTVGTSQRRTREWARFQCVVHRRWDADATFALLAAPDAPAAATRWRDRVGEITDAPVVAAVSAALERLT